MESQTHEQVADLLSSFHNHEQSPLLRYDEESQSNLVSSVRSVQSIQSNLPVSIPPVNSSMKIQSYQLSREHGLIECPQEKALAGAKKGGSKHFWIDIRMNCNEDIRPWLENLALPSFVIDVLAEPPENWASQVIPLPKALLVVVRIVNEPTTSDEDRLVHQAALQLKNIVVTLQNTSTSTAGRYPYTDKLSSYQSHSRDVHDESLVLRKRLRERRHQSCNSRGALITWLRLHLDQTAYRTRTLRHEVVRMDETMDRDITKVELEEIITCKDELLRILSVAEEQTACLEHLCAAAAGHHLEETSPSSNDTTRTSMSILLATAQATERMSLRLEKHITDLRQRCQGYEQEVMNRRLAVLTVLSAVFLPLTLFTGIWGMNFQNMPELSKPYSYPLALLFMISIASVMIFYFRRAGWFD